MITKRVVVDRIEVTNAGAIQVKFDKQLVENGEKISGEPHRTAFTPGCDIAAQMAAVNLHLSQMTPSWPAVDASAEARIAAIAALEWTPEVIAAAQAAQQAKSVPA